MNLELLKLEIPFKWKIQSFNKDKTKASCVAYIDARDVMDILDSVVWQWNWQDDYKKRWDEMMWWIWINIEWNWVWKWDTWNRLIETEYNKDIVWKAQVSDSFKRAWVKWGIGRFLYNQNILWVNINQYKEPIDKDWKKLDNKEFQEYCHKLNDYFNNK